MKIFIIGIATIFLLHNCKEEEYRKPVLAGVYDSTYFFQEFLPPMQISSIQDSNSLYIMMCDSIDIDSDSNFDIIIYKQNEFYINSYYPKSYSIDFKNGFETAYVDEKYPQGRGSYTEQRFIDTINYNKQIQIGYNWIGNKEIIVWISALALVPPEGPWFEIKKAFMYIGLRRIDGENVKFGWICLDATDKKNLKFLSFAFEK